MYNIVTTPISSSEYCADTVIPKHILPNSVQARPKHMFLTVYKPFLVPPVPVDDVGLADHLVEPVLDGGVLAPPLLGTLVSDAVHRYLMTLYSTLITVMVMYSTLLKADNAGKLFFTQLQRLKRHLASR